MKAPTVMGFSETRCLNCGRTLTNAKGVRLLSANFSSELPMKEAPDNVVWARCTQCLNLALKIRKSKRE